MEWVKTTAKTLPEAIDLALDNLGVDESEAEIVILEEPRQGLFGRMRGTARVEARVRPKPIRPKNERSRNRKGRSEDGSRSRNRNKKRGDGDRSRNRSEGAGDDKGRSGGQGGRSRDRDQGQGGSGGSGSRQRRGRGGQGGRSGSGRQERDEKVSGSRTEDKRGQTSSGSNGGEAKPSEGATVEEVATHLQTFLTELTEAFGLDGGVSIDDSEEGTLVGRIEGRHGLLVGPKGRTLDAVQELARISCQRTAPSSVRIKVDVGGYREQRTAALAEFARKAAERAVAEGVEVALEPMSAADRKAVHDALNGHDQVETRSVGAEPRRRVVVVPLDADDDDAGDDEAEAVADDGLNESDDGAEDRPVTDEEE